MFHSTVVYSDTSSSLVAAFLDFVRRQESQSEEDEDIS